MWATAEDVTSRWIGPGAPSPSDPVLPVIVEDAEDEILTVFPKIAERVASGEVRLITLKRIVVAMVTRVYRNPENLSQLQRTTGPFMQGKSYRSEGIVGLELTDSEKDKLSPANRGKAFMVDLMPARPEFPYSINGGA